MAGGTKAQMDLDLEFCLATEEDFNEVMAMSTGIYYGMDYMGARFHKWLQEPNRKVFLAKRKGQVIALESTLIVDDGETVIVEGLRVAPWERGHGIARMIQSHCTEFIKTNHPEVKRRRQAFGNEPDPKVLSKFRLLAERMVLLFRFKAGDIDKNLDDVIRGMETGGKVYWQPTILRADDVKRIYLDREIIDTVLPCGKIFQDWQPLEPIESNVALLLSREIIWMADRPEHPRFLSLSTYPYQIPMGEEFYRLNIDLFGKVLDEAKKHFVAQVQNLSSTLKGTVVCLLFTDTSLFAEMEEFVEKIPGVEKMNFSLRQLLLEEDL